MYYTKRHLWTFFNVESRNTLLVQGQGTLGSKGKDTSMDPYLEL